MAALYRPAAVPVLDGHLAMAFGFSSGAFRPGRERRQRIAAVVDGVAAALDRYQQTLAEIRADARAMVPDLALIPDLRLLDMIIWTSQDDRLSRPGKKAGEWLDADLSNRRPITLDDAAPVFLAPAEADQAR
jgi:hypothetical protein